jgi:ribosomal protein S27AE
MLNNKLKLFRFLKMQSLQVDSKAPGLNPNSRVCYICGRLFGSASIGIHEKSCKEKFEKEQQHLPKSKRLSLPSRPTGNTAQDYNDAAFASYMDQARAECPNCSRKFLADRLEIHLRSCTPDGFFARKSLKSQMPSLSPVPSIKKTDKPTTSGSIKSLEAKSIPKIISTLDKKFCTQCGKAFHSAADKFCGECGLKR